MGAAFIALALTGCRGGGNKLAAQFEADADEPPAEAGTSVEEGGTDARWNTSDASVDHTDEEDGNGNYEADAADGSVDSSLLGQCAPELICAAAGCATECDGGRCVVEHACANPDPAHCVALCDTTASPTVCVIAARDLDADGHGDALCGAAPGDDCNDGEASVYPGAPELCDGLDNDCDGPADTFDGLPVGGLVTDVAYGGATGSVGIVAVPGEIAFEAIPATTYSSTGLPLEIFLQTTGVYLRSSTSALRALEPAAAPAPSGVILTGALGSAAALELVGAPAPSPGAIAISSGVVTGTSIAKDDSGALMVAWTQGNSDTSLRFRRVTPNGPSGVEAILPVGGVPRRPGLAVSPQGYALIRIETVATTSPSDRAAYVRVSLLDPVSLQETVPMLTLDSWLITGGIVDPETKSEDVRPQIFRMPGDYVVGWFDGQGHLELQRLGFSGSVICGPVQIDGAAGWGLSNSIAAASSSALVAFTDAQAQARLVRMDERCVVDEERPVLSEPGSKIALGDPVPGLSTRIGQPAIANLLGPGFAMGWVKEGGPDGGLAGMKLFTLRIVGPHLCN